MKLETFHQASPVETRTASQNNTWVEVRLGSILRNLARIRSKMRPFTRVMAVVKANAYGHGIVSVSKALEGQVDFLGVGSLKEASLLREQGVTAPLFLFGRLFPDEIFLALQMKLTLTVSSKEEARAISEMASRYFRKKKVPIHIKIDTGMNRLGIPQNQAFSEIQRVASYPALQLEGIYTHFPTAERFPDPFTQGQLDGFEKLIEDLRRIGISFRFRHAANSAGALRFKSHFLNLVRPGIALYGIYPHPSFESEIELEAALSLKSRIVFLKQINSGESVGYGREFIAERQTQISVLPVGYAHGYPFQLSKKAQVLCQGKRFPLAGRVCMDSLTVDLGFFEKVSIGEEVVLLGVSEKETIRAEELASFAGTIPYEIVTRLDPGIPRIYKD